MAFDLLAAGSLEDGLREERLANLPHQYVAGMRG